MMEFWLDNGISGIITEVGEGGDGFIGLVGHLPKLIIGLGIVMQVLTFYTFLAWLTGGFTDVFRTGAVEFVDEFIRDAMPWPVYLLGGLIVVSLAAAACQHNLHEMAGWLLLVLGALLWPAISLLYTSVVDMGDVFRWYMIPASLLFSLLLLPVTVAIALLFFFLARLVLVAFGSLYNLAGESDSHKNTDVTPQSCAGKVQDKSANMARLAADILSGVGGKANVSQVQACATRLRFTLKDSTKVKADAIKTAGAAGVICPGRTECQVVVGVRAAPICQELQKLLCTTT